MISQIAAIADRFCSDPVAASLLLGDVIATLLVGIGIVLEVENPDRRQKIAVSLVVVGVFAETVCSVWLFDHDASIMEAQRTKIITLAGENDELWMKARSRIILDRQCFVGRLAHKPPLSVDIVYTKDDSEAYLFALQIESLLGERGIGWKVRRPHPLTEAEALPLDLNRGLSPDAPLEIRAGVWIGGMTIVVSAAPHEYPLPSPSNGPVVALNWAFLQCANEGGEIAVDPRMSAGEVRIIVTRKSARQPL
jgi:hypothetical protein